jgi:hypothetical protein
VPSGSPVIAGLSGWSWRTDPVQPPGNLGVGRNHIRHVRNLVDHGVHRGNVGACHDRDYIWGSKERVRVNDAVDLADGAKHFLGLSG